MKVMPRIAVLLLLLVSVSSFISIAESADEISSSRAESVIGEGYQHRFRGDLMNTGVSLSLTAPENNRTVWEFQGEDDIYSSAVVAEGKLYFGSWDKKLHCLDALTGRELWTFDTQDRIYSTPTFYNGMVYIGTGIEGGSKIAKLYAVNASSGDLVWSFKAGKNFVSGPVVVDGILYAGSLDGTMYALDAKGSGDGTTSVYWRYTTGGEIWSTPAVYNDSLYFTVADCRLYRIDIDDGQEIWRFQSEYTLDGMWSSPAIGDGMVFFGSAFNPLGKLYALDADTGAHIWNRTTGKSRYGIGASPGYYDGVVYIGANNGVMYAFNASDGAELWNFTTGDDYNGIYSSPTYADGKIYFGSSDNFLYSLNSSTGELIWSHRSGGFGEYGMVASPTIVSGRLYAGFTGDDIMYCFGDTIIPEISISLSIKSIDTGETRSHVYAEEDVELVLTAFRKDEGWSVEDEVRMEDVGLILGVEGGELGQEEGGTDENGELRVLFFAPVVERNGEVELTVRAEAVGHLSEEVVFVISVWLNPPLTYELESSLDNIFAYRSAISFLNVLDDGQLVDNVTVELRITDGKIQPLKALTNETGRVRVVYTAPEPGENNTLRNVTVYIRLIKPGYEIGLYEVGLGVLPPVPPKNGGDDEGIDGILLGLIIAIVVLAVIIAMGLTMKGKKYW